MHKLHIVLKYCYIIVMSKFKPVNTFQFLHIESYMSVHKQAILYCIQKAAKLVKVVLKM